jgi:hypothetical protein
MIKPLMNVARGGGGAGGQYVLVFHKYNTDDYSGYWGYQDGYLHHLFRGLPPQLP